MDIRQKKGAIIIGTVTLAVVTGVVTWNALARTEEADTGEIPRLETADPQAAGMTAREQGLLDKNEELKRRLAEAEARATRVRMKAEDVVTPVAADVVAEQATDLEARFVDDKYGAALAGVNWRIVGSAMKGLLPITEQLAEAILATGEMPLVLAGELQQLNGKLVAQLQPLMDGEVPGTGTGGTFTHPLVVANQVDQVLAAGDIPLSQDQSDRLAAIANHYLAQDENLRVSADGHEFSLETILQETAMKALFREEMEQILSTEQRDMLYPEAVQDYNGLDMFGTGLVWAQVAKPIWVDGPEELARKNFARFTEGLQLREDQQERLRPLLDNWSRSYPEEYWSDQADNLEKIGMLKTSRTRIAGERQLALFRAMLNNLGLTAEQRQKLTQNNGVMVPLVR